MLIYPPLCHLVSRAGGGICWCEGCPLCFCPSPGSGVTLQDSSVFTGHFYRKVSNSGLDKHRLSLNSEFLPLGSVGVEVGFSGAEPVKAHCVLSLVMVRNRIQDPSAKGVQRTQQGAPARTVPSA